jgi:hypothetical protein
LIHALALDADKDVALDLAALRLYERAAADITSDGRDLLVLILRRRQRDNDQTSDEHDLFHEATSAKLVIVTESRFCKNSALSLCYDAGLPPWPETGFMDKDLRPMSAALVLDRTFQIYRSHFAVLAGIGLPLPMMLLLLRLVFIPLGYPPRSSAAFRNTLQLFSLLFEYSGSWTLIYMIGQAFTGAATVYAVSKFHLGEAVTIGESYRNTLPRFGTVLRIAWNIYVRFAGAAITTYALCFGILVGLEASTNLLSRASQGTGLVVLGLIIIFVPMAAGLCWMLYIYAKYCMAVPASLMESLAARPALKRSRFLAKGSIRRISLIYTLMFAMGLVFSTLLWLPDRIYVSFHGHSYLISILLNNAGSFLASALAGPISTIAVALMYYDQRIRKEAFDLQWMMDSMAPSSQPVAPEVPVTMPQR